jgi:hypothetical protein
MALTGHLSDLSLSELIEFFCNQRKVGRIKVLYPQGFGYFYLQAGSVVDARIGVLRGIEAVYYALTLANAKFEFSGSSEPMDRTINQPWTQVVLEGLRRLDEGITPAEAFPQGYRPQNNEGESIEQQPTLSSDVHDLHMPALLSFMDKESMAKQKPLIASAVGLVVLGSIAVIGIPAGWYSRAKVAVAASQPDNSSAQILEAPSPSDEKTPKAEDADTSIHAADTAAVARRKRERERAKARVEKAAMVNRPSTPSLSDATSGAIGSAKAGPKKILVTVTYDESGRVTQASGGDATALRIARQKRFPPGRAGSATITILIN